MGLARDALPPHRDDDELDGYDFGDVITDADEQYQQVISLTIKCVK